MKNLWRLIPILLSLIVVGCSLNPPKDAVYFTENKDRLDGYAKLYIYRPNMFIGGGVWPEMYFNETKVVGLKNQGYTVVFIKPGKYKIRTEKSSILSGMGNIPGEIEINDANEYYLLLDQYYCQLHYSNGYCLIHSGAMDYQRWTLKAKEEAIPVISNCYYLEPYVNKVTIVK
ncbi:hypothetical protein GCM10011352_01240 [Marinobacterium zhoushanense]|uniref:DUF2846 domain-containing protein n=1 Tax=Marinobacterium zhoushanense TaxID=1679163 RepID=A0ABQ1JZE1_9GAMM|nr:DUF2846 domain-containing protein [Marinobacterium zhoushanense]GGB79343.1 hypothetical protein GCM10011352_01240 [Marinobacterium zhoushanense]